MSESFDRQYFDSHIATGTVLKRPRADKWPQYSFWRRFLKRNLSHFANVLEVGCGLGFFGRRLRDNFGYVGVDISSFAINYARRFHGPLNVVQAQAQHLPFKQNSFDAVIAFDVVEHLQNPRQFIHEVREVMKPQGLFIVTTPNVRSFGVEAKSRSKTLKPSMYSDGTHVSLLTPETWSQMLTDESFRIAKLGTDTLWDYPYYERFPQNLQKAVLMPLHVVLTILFGFLPWTKGENLVLVAKK